MYKPKAEFLICGDTNTNYLIDRNKQTKKKALLLTTFNVTFSKF
jgi:hypothetical protein